MDVQATNMTIESMLGKGRFSIPDYQRQYDWGDDEITEFIEDIMYNIEKEYFIGHMVFEGTMSGTEFSVIDGQQRITTITILLCVIRDIYFLNFNNEDLSDGINLNYIFRKDRKSQLYPVLETKMPYPLFQYYVQAAPQDKANSLEKENKPSNIGEEKILSAYNYFRNILQDKTLEDLDKLTEKILNLEIIFVAAQERVNAHSIFMTLNAKGKDLTFVDLIKNDVFSRYKNPPAIPDELEQKWKSIQTNFGERGEAFFVTFWRSRYKPNIRTEKIYKEYELLAKGKEFAVKEFVNHLLEDSRRYAKIINPTQTDWIDSNRPYINKVFFSLHAIKKVFGLEVVDTFLLSLLRAYDDKKISLAYLIKTLRCMEKFHFIKNAICTGRLAGFEKLYPRHAIDLFSMTDKQKAHMELKSFQKKINQKIPLKSEFEEKFDERVYFFVDSNKDEDKKAKLLVKYCLEKIEYCKHSNIIFQNLSIEHIYAKFYVENNNFPKEVVQNIGNLILLDRDLNSEIGHLPFAQKREIILKKNKISSSNEAIEQKTFWDITDINDRRNMLVDRLYSMKD